MRKSWIGVVVAGLLLAACGGGSDAGDGHSGPDEGVEAPAAADQAEGRALAGDEVAVGAAASTLPGVGPSVIKTAEIALEIERGEFKAALQQATAVASAEGGFVLSSGVEGREARRGSIVLRIPSDRFEAALASLRDLGSVGRERVSGEDVGQEFVDLEARLRNLRAQEAVLLRLMNEAQTVTDTIRVQKELTGIQLEVEQIRGRLRYLHDQASFGTISVSMAEAGVVAPGEPGIIAQAWERAVEGFLAVIGGLITALGVLVPIAVLALLGWVVIRRRLPAKA
ncbi:MAG TPA: DUF4349 domain-containing protein [Actinomycetota bacterium]|nr:DUF4349 domain-containing protein [Actinomycetota bacterium]